MEAFVGVFRGCHSGRCGAATRRNNKSIKNVFIRTAAIASFAGLLAGGYWAWNQIPACAEVGTDAVTLDPHGLRFGDAGLEYEYNLEQGKAARRLSQVDDITASLVDDKPHEKSPADLKSWRDIIGILIIGVSCMAAVSAGTGGKQTQPMAVSLNIMFICFFFSSRPIAGVPICSHYTANTTSSIPGASWDTAAFMLVAVESTNDNQCILLLVVLFQVGLFTCP